MSSLWMNNNGRVDICDSGVVRLSDCPGFECRQVCYVDKYAGGTEDGSSWANAYTDIQSAITAKPYYEIQIKGYGENDCYPAGTIVYNCVFLKGIGDVWIFGDFTQKGFYQIRHDLDSYNVKMENINVKNCVEAFADIFYANFINCNAVNCGTGFTTCNYSSFLNCSATFGTFGFSGRYNNYENCIADNNGDNGFAGYSTGTFSIYTNCTSNNNARGFYVIGNSTLINCVANYNAHWGFGGGDNSIFEGCQANGNARAPSMSGVCYGAFYANLDSSFSNCSASDNYGCGFNYNPGSTFVGCSETGNCVSGNSTCTPGKSNYICDEV